MKKMERKKTNRRRAPRAVTACCVLLAAAAFCVVGCGKGNQGRKIGSNKSADGPTEQGTLVVLCGSSFVPPIKALIDEFEKRTGIKVEYTVPGSEDFLPQVKTHSQGDILVTHDPYLQYTKEANALAVSAHVGYVAPVLAVQKGNPKNIKSIADLARPGLRVALSNPKYSTCGEMVFRLLEKKGIKDAVLKNVGNRLTKGHHTLGQYLQLGTVDAVMMWNGVANTFKEHLEIVKTPYEYDEERRVHVIGLSYSKHPQWVKKFVDLAKTEGKRLFAEHGYVK